MSLLNMCWARRPDRCSSTSRWPDAERAIRHRDAKPSAANNAAAPPARRSHGKLDHQIFPLPISARPLTNDSGLRNRAPLLADDRVAVVAAARGQALDLPIASRARSPPPSASIPRGTWRRRSVLGAPPTSAATRQAGAWEADAGEAILSGAGLTAVPARRVAFREHDSRRFEVWTITGIYEMRLRFVVSPVPSVHVGARVVPGASLGAHDDRRIRARHRLRSRRIAKHV